MKICTITCHDVYNHGASLQAYALMRFLKTKGHEVEIIDYKPPYLSGHYNLLSINNPVWERNILMKLFYLTIKLPERLLSLRRKKAFDAFTSNYLLLTKARYTSNDELKRNPPYADVFLCGSDQIWNPLRPNGSDPAFYLDFVPEGKIKASYAASFATDTIEHKYADFMKRKLQSFHAIGVRESSGVRIVNSFRMDMEAQQVMDPAFLLNKSDWDEVGTETIHEDYVLVYDFDDSPLIRDIALNIAKRERLKIFSINKSKLHYASKYFSYKGPSSFVSLIRHAKFVVSNSFHAAVFSIIYEKKFVIVNREEAINTRMRDLLYDLKLSDHLVVKLEPYEQLTRDIDYKLVKQLLTEKIERSKQYIEGILTHNSRGEIGYEKIAVRH